MLLLAATTDKIQVVTDAGATVDVHASFLDISNAAPPVVQGSSSGRQNTAITTAATTDVVAAPGASTLRNVKTLLIRNKDASVSVGVTVRFNQNGTSFDVHKATLNAGDALHFVEGVGFVTIAAQSTADLLYVLAADAAGSNVLTAQPWFPSTGSVSVAALTYAFEGLLILIRAAGTTSHVTNLLFAGSATVSSIQYVADVPASDVETTSAVNRNTIRTTASSTVKAASTSATEAVSILVHGVVRFSATGTFTPQFIYSAAPGGAPTIKANSYFRMKSLGALAFTTQGTWS